MPDDQKKLVWLESIRGIAALIVVTDHLLFAFGPGVIDPRAPGYGTAPDWLRTVERSPLSVAWNGSFAVNLFFILSGFVLSYSYFRTGGQNAVTAPALRRYFRLAVPSGVSMVAAFVLVELGWFSNLPAAALIGSPWLGECYSHFKPVIWGWRENGLVYQCFFGLFAGGSYPFNNVLWTMRVELIGSFLVYVTLALFGRVRRRFAIYAVLGLLLLINGQVWRVGFIAGMAACDLYAGRERRGAVPVDIGRWGWAVLLLGLAVGGETGVALPVIHRATPWFGYHLPLGAALVIAAPLVSNSVRRPLSSRPLAFLGRISFGLYLVHVLVICSIGCLVLSGLTTGRGWGLAPAAVTAATVSLVLSLGFGWVMYHVADRPSIAIGRRVSAWFIGDAGQAGASAGR